MTIAIIVAVLLFLLWFFLAPAGPAREKGASLSSIGEATSRLALMTEGSRLTVTHDASGRSLSLVKAPDTRETTQTIVATLSENEWSPQAIDGLQQALAETPLCECSTQPDTSGRTLHCVVRDNPIAMDHSIRAFLSRALPELGIDPKDRFSLRLEGAMDYAIWRRINAGPLSKMAGDDQHWIMRRFARWHLRKRRSEEEE